MSDLYRDFIDQKADQIINSLGGTITPPPANAELYRDFLDRKFDDVINAVDSLIKLKKYTYTGNGQNTLELPINPDLIINISGNITATSVVNITMPYCKGNYYITSERSAFGGGRTYGQHQVTWNNDNIVFSNSRADFLSDSLNKNNIEYTVYYI